LSNLYPQLASEWHPTKNIDLTPEHVASGLNQESLVEVHGKSGPRMGGANR